MTALMGPELAGCAALALVVLMAPVPRVNLSVVAPVLALLLAAWAGLRPGQVAGAVPWLLFVRLVLVTGLFAITAANGTLERLAWLLVRGTGFRPALAGPLCFLASLALASAGPGNFAAASLLTPVAMQVARQLGVSAFLMSVMVVYGATAGAFSPVSPTGIVAHDALLRADIPHSQWTLYLASLVAHLLVALTIYLATGGWRLTRPDAGCGPANTELAWEAVHRRTVRVLTVFLLVAMLGVMPVEWAAGAAVSAIAALRAVPDIGWVRQVPWRLIGLVCGVSLLAGVVEETGGMAMLGRLLAAAARPEWLPGTLAGVAGVVSVAASSIGVVLPAFLPTVNDIVAAAGGGDPTAIAYAICVGAHLVDISPLSPLGAMCVAFGPVDDSARARLYRQLMGLGLLMCVVGAALCQVLFGGAQLPGRP
jgi:di/tricarboxylate transporter